jgi:sporulation protein YlmC with PRC-barrel domain
MTAEVPNKLESQLDGALDLLDRQLIDAEGKLLGKIDDVELTQTDQGLVITALLTGPIALLHRLGGRAGDELATKYVQLRPSEADRDRPWRIVMDDVARLDSAMHLSVRREGVLRRDLESRRLGRLTGMDVTTPEGRRVGRVLDARFRPLPDGHLVLGSLLVGHGRAGSLLGYDRRERHGPWLIRRIVRWLHRHTRVVDVDAVQIQWNNEEVRLMDDLEVLGRPPRSPES